jgi:hypothetical protein
MRRLPTLSGSESLAFSLVATAALLIVVAYLGDRVGVAFAPGLMLTVAGVAGMVMLAAFGRKAAWDRTETATFVTVVAITFAWLLWIARPSFFPLGTGPDLTHHLLLINYIEAHWTLVHDPGVQEYLGEMVQYTPGSHIVTALAGAWSGSNGLHAMHAVMAASAALKTGFVFLMAMRVLPRDLPRVPIAALGSLSLFASQTYFLGAFAQYSFLAQAIAECFAIAMFWALTSWDQDQNRWLMAATGLLGAALFLTWPILIGPPLVVLGLLVVLPKVRLKADTTYREQLLTRAIDAMIAAVPIALVAGLFSIGRMDYVVIAGTGGEVATPVVRAYGWLFLVLSSAGIAIATASLKARTTSRTLALFAGAILLQAGALYLFARSRGNDPYMARKMFYMLLYPQAVGVAVAVGTIWRALMRVLPSPAKAGHHVRTVQMLGWGLVVIAAVIVARPLVGAPKSLIVAKHPATSIELEQAGQWVREHVDPHCVDYLVGDDNTAYWLHLAVLGNPRRGARTGDNATYELTPALVRWLTPGGLPYAIADLRVLPTDIKNSSDIVAQFGSAAVIKRQGPSACGSA